MLVLGIETSCDETACAVVKDGEEILSNTIASQEEHEAYGGVYPEMAARRHVDAIIPVVRAAMQGIERVDLVAVTRGPGLIGSLLIGLNAAKALALGWGIPYVGVNHVEAHLYAAMMGREQLFPALGVVVSGGHTFLVKIVEVGHYEEVGTTVDDAVGEAFDKVATLLGLPYPGGPHVERLAQTGDPKRFRLRAGRVKGRPLDFSFSGLKTNVLYLVKGQNGSRHSVDRISEAEKADIAASFQEAALKDIASKARRAAQEFGCRAIYVGGGVSQNRRLRELLQGDLPLFLPEPELCLDNAAMIAGLGYHLFGERSGDPLTLEPKTRVAMDRARGRWG